LAFPFGKSEIVGPGQYSVAGRGFYGMIPTSSVREIFCSMARPSKDGRVRATCLNASDRVQWFGPRISVAAALLYPQARVHLRTAFDQDERVWAQEPDYWDEEAKQLIRESPGVLNRNSPFDEEETWFFIVRSEEIQWRFSWNRSPGSIGESSIGTGSRASPKFSIASIN